MRRHGFVRVAAAVPRVRVADCAANVVQILLLMEEAQKKDVDLLVFPELSLTGYTCGDLFLQPTLLEAASNALIALTRVSQNIFQGVTVVGLPMICEDRLFNVAAVIARGRVLGIVPKSFPPNYKEFYEGRWFASGLGVWKRSIQLGAAEVPFGTDLLFVSDWLRLGIEICEDLWAPLPPSSYQALAGANLLVNLSASNEVIGKAAYRRQLVASQSGRCMAGYVYVSCGPLESTSDLVFGGHALIAENGAILAESETFRRDGVLLVSEIDTARLTTERLSNSTFGGSKHVATEGGSWRDISLPPATTTEITLTRPIDAHPFVPRGESELAQRCEEIFQIQVAGLAKRLEHLETTSVTLGVSGGLDSTLALLVTCKTLDLLGLPRSSLAALTMPGFGTSRRTLTNALALIEHLGLTGQEIDIRGLCMEEMRLLGHRPFGINLEGLALEQFTKQLDDVPSKSRNDLVFENVQARMRTSLLMNRGFVVGTGDLSELALGWCTYNADHMSMYNPNVSIPKTLVKFLVRWVAENEFAGPVRDTLLDVVATQISPELLPLSKEGKMEQMTEGVVGPYELHDFFLFHFLRYGAPPDKILFLAKQASFHVLYTEDELKKWLKVFIERFFAQQYKRSCFPDGPKVGTVSLSPRGDWRMPSDAAARVWLERLE